MTGLMHDPLESLAGSVGVRSFDELRRWVAEADAIENVRRETQQYDPVATLVQATKASTSGVASFQSVRDALQVFDGTQSAMAALTYTGGGKSLIPTDAASYTAALEAVKPEALKHGALMANDDYWQRFRRTSNAVINPSWPETLESRALEYEPLVFDPPDFGPSMAEIMEEQSRQHEERHREQFAVVQRMAAASEASAQAAKESEQAAQESLELTRKSLRNSRIANWISFGALVLTALAYVASSST